ncbi:MAG: hypothetical protein KTR14_05915 [Vampirovibrio sp.]|nr:hypothetical protein [Vampirovibrio sp.]
MVNPKLQIEVEVRKNEFDEILIATPNKEFVADLMFMNQFAVCAGCDAIHCWEYYFPNKVQ